MRHLLFSIIAWMAFGFCQTGKTFYFGVIGPWGGFYAAGRHTSGAIPIALEDVRKDNVTFYEINSAGYQFNYLWTDTKCNPSVGIPEIAKLLYGTGPFNQKVDVIFGSVCSVVCEPGGYLAREMNVPMVSFACFSDLLSDKSIYPTFARTSGPITLVAPVYMHVLKSFSYSRVALFLGAEPFYTLLGSAIRNSLLDSGITVTDLIGVAVLSSGGTANTSTDLSVIRHR